MPRDWEKNVQDREMLEITGFETSNVNSEIA